MLPKRERNTVNPGPITSAIQDAAVRIKAEATAQLNNIYCRAMADLEKLRGRIGWLEGRNAFLDNEVNGLNAQVRERSRTIKVLQEQCSTFAANGAPYIGIRFTPEADAVLRAALKVDRHALDYVASQPTLAFHALAKAALAVLAPPAAVRAAASPCCDVGSQVSYAVPPV